MNKIKYIYSFFLISSLLLGQSKNSSDEALRIIKLVDDNMISETQIIESEMIVYGKEKVELSDLKDFLLANLKILQNIYRLKEKKEQKC